MLEEYKNVQEGGLKWISLREKGVDKNMQCGLESRRNSALL